MIATDSAEGALLTAVTKLFAIDPNPESFNALVRRRVPPNRGTRFTHDRPDTCIYIARSRNTNVVAYTANLIPQCRAGSVTPFDSAVHPEVSIDCACDINPADPIHPYFVNLEPSYLAERRRKGIVGDCDDLNFMERRVAYGYRHKSLDVPLEMAAMFANGGLSPEGSGNPMDEGQRELAVQWWSTWQPFVVNFVALTSLPGLLLRLPPLGTGMGNSRDAAGTDNSSGDPTACDSSRNTVPVIIAIIYGELSVLERVYVKSVERWLRLPYVEYIEIFGVSIGTGEPTYERKNNDGTVELPADAEES